MLDDHRHDKLVAQLFGQGGGHSRFAWPIGGKFDGPNIVTAERFIAEDELVVVEGRNHSVTKRGDAYANRYSWTLRFIDGKVSEITEYTDTELIARVLDPLTIQSW